MKPIFLLLLATTLCLGCNNQNQSTPSVTDSTSVKTDTTVAIHEILPFKADVPNADMQIKLAVLAAPPEKRDSATVYGYDANNNLAVIRKGTNEMICLADDPTDTSFSVACYNKDLEPLMQSGRELRKQGMSGKQLFDERAKEVKEGKLQMPKSPAALYVYSADGKDVNHSTGEVKNGYLRYVIYVPFATAASTGLPEKPSAPGMPWIMDPGTYHAHVMINP
ncbi:MAG TPA: hypothetical protein VLS85_04250 [Hanamia sp.]|nr:hypothetical protein [Hanamia sp.]